MAQRASTAQAARLARHQRLRKKLAGTSQRPRLSVFRSLSHIYAQVIDDQQGQTLAAASSLDTEAKAGSKKKKAEMATLVGGLVAQRAKAAGITQVVFDRGGYQYQGRVRALADAARKGGLVF